MPRRLRNIAAAMLFAAVLVCVVAIPVQGANYASQVNITVTVNPNESCLVNVTATLHIDDSTQEKSFPVPLEATAISLNGSSWISVTRSNQAQYIDLSNALGNMTGDFTITVQYSLPDVVHTGAAGTPQLQLPLLCGYKSPISRLNFSVTLPGDIAEKPAFSSGYHHANIEKDISYTLSGNSISGFSLTELKDHETLEMTLPVEASMFPNAPLVFYESDNDDTAMLICAAVALLYWLVFMRCLPPRRQQSTSAPEGVSAGQLGAVMTLGKADLSLMVFSWAQLGYISIQVLKSGRVVLVRQMDMGNERNAFEQRCFKALFGKRDRVDTSGSGYAAYCKKVSRMNPELQSLVKSRSGNPLLFRAIGAVVSLFGGIAFGIAMSQGAALQGFWVFLVATFGLVFGWFMQQTTHELLLRKGPKTLWGIVISLLWLVLGALAGQFGVALMSMLWQWLVGLMTVFGGQRTAAGRQDLSRILGLRRYLTRVSSQELQRIQSIDPDYFHSLAPYAMALGVDKTFARRFGKAPIADCPYLVTSDIRSRSAAQWNDLLQKTISAMDRRSRFLLWERVLEILALLKK